MKHLYEKHQSNIDSAEFLINKHKMYAPSVHCSYYATFQLIKFKLGKLESKSCHELDLECKKIKASSHKFIFNSFIKSENVKKKLSEEDIFDITDSYDNLKEYRIKSDYRDYFIKKDSAIDSLNYSKVIIKLIKDL